MPNLIDKIEAMSTRLNEAREIVMMKNARFNKADGEWRVKSNTSGKTYRVSATCECADYQVKKELTKGFCKHRLAVALMQKYQPETKSVVSDIPQLATEPRQLNEPMKPIGEQGWCQFHNVKLYENVSGTSKWYSHKQGTEWCKGQGTPSEREAA